MSCARARFSSVSGEWGESTYLAVRMEIIRADRDLASVIVSRPGPERRSVRVIEGMVGCSSVPMRRVVLFYLHTKETKSSGRRSPRINLERGGEAERMWGYTRPLG